jgi:hypothetical protein
MTKDDFVDAKTLWKFFYAHECFKRVENACSFTLEHKLDEEHPIYYSLITSIYIIYGKPFKKSNVVGKLPDDIVPTQYEELHKLLLDHRDQLYAHTDAKSFDLPDHGAANQVRFLVLPGEIRLFGTQFRARPPLLPDIVSLCQELQTKAGYHINKLRKRHQKKIPLQVGEYAINVLDQGGTFVLRQKPMMLKTNET